MPKGKIKFFNAEKGYGFISDETGQDIFVHSSGLFDVVQQGDEVMYEITPGRKGPAAANVRKIPG